MGQRSDALFSLYFMLAFIGLMITPNFSEAKRLLPLSKDAHTPIVGRALIGTQANTAQFSASKHVQRLLQSQIHQAHALAEYEYKLKRYGDRIDNQKSNTSLRKRKQSAVLFFRQLPQPKKQALPLFDRQNYAEAQTSNSDWLVKLNQQINFAKEDLLVVQAISRSSQTLTTALYAVTKKKASTATISTTSPPLNPTTTDRNWIPTPPKQRPFFPFANNKKAVLTEMSFSPNDDYLIATDNGQPLLVRRNYIWRMTDGALMSDFLHGNHYGSLVDFLDAYHFVRNDPTSTAIVTLPQSTKERVIVRYIDPLDPLKISSPAPAHAAWLRYHQIPAELITTKMLTNLQPAETAPALEAQPAVIQTSPDHQLVYAIETAPYQSPDANAPASDDEPEQQFSLVTYTYSPKATAPHQSTPPKQQLVEHRRVRLQIPSNIAASFDLDPVLTDSRLVWSIDRMGKWVVRITSDHLIFFDAKTGAPHHQQTLTGEQSPHYVQLSDDARHFIFADDMAFHIWQTEPFKKIRSGELTQPIHSTFAISHNAQWIAYGDYLGKVHVQSLLTGDPHPTQKEIE